MAASAAINILVLGVSGILSIPAFTNLFPKPELDKISIRIGVGATNSSFSIPSGTNGPGGNTPSVELFDVNGNSMGRATSSIVVADGGSVGLTISAAKGSTASETPEYIQLIASGTDEVCISWFTTSSATSDFRSWNGATAQACGLPWYPSTAPFPGVATPYQPPCFWMSNDGRFVDGFSARLTDFFFPGSSGGANSTATQWKDFPDTLCEAPARQQFYNNPGACIPFYPSGLSVVNKKDPDTGFDVDFDAIKSSFTLSCSFGGIPFNCGVNINPGLPPETCIATDTFQTLPASITSLLQSQISFNLGGGPIPAQPPPPATSDLVEDTCSAQIEIPTSVIEKQPMTTELLEPAEPSIEAGNQGAVAISFNPGGPSGTWEAIPPPVVGGAARLRALRSAYRASILQRRKDPENTSVHAFTSKTALNQPPAITSAPIYSPRKRQQRPTNRKEPVLNRRIENRAEQPHQWCQENQLVISEFDGHSAVQVCESETSWGPDFISITEGIFCDMCNRHSYPLCSSGKSTISTCFDLSTKQLLTSRRDEAVPVKKYINVRHWK